MQQRAIDPVEPRLDRVEKNFAELRKDLHKFTETLTAMQVCESNGFRSTDAQTRASPGKKAAERDEKLEKFMNERLEFEQQAEKNFQSITQRIEEVSETLAQLIKVQQEQANAQKLAVAAVKRQEIENLERVICGKMDQLLHTKLKETENSLKSSYSSLRNMANETQVR